MELNMTMFPLPGAADLTLPVWQLRDIWRRQRVLVDQLRQAQVSYGTVFSIELDSLRYWVCQALSVLENFIQQGHSQAEPGVTVDNFSRYVTEFLKQLSTAQVAWRAWMGPPARSKTQALEKAKVLGGKPGLGFGATTTAEVLAPGDVVTPSRTLLEDATRSRTWDEYKILFAMAAGLGLLAYALKK